jgi:hypothetical protein
LDVAVIPVRGRRPNTICLLSPPNSRELARPVDEPTRSLLEKALALGSGVVALTIDDRERLLWVLDDVRTDALAQLRAVLVQEWRRQGGL